MPKHKSKSDELKNRVEELFSADLAGVDQVGEMDLYGESIFRTAFENSSVPMCITGLDGHFMLVNRAFADVLGYSQEEMAGKSFQELTHPEDTSIGGEAMKAMLSGASSTAQIQKRYLRKDEQAVWAELNITLIHDLANKPQYFVSIIQIITEQKNTATMLDKRVRELDCLNDIGHKIDEQPPLAEFLGWVPERIPAAMLYPEECIAAIEFQGEVYGNAAARDLTSKVVGGIRVAGELLGWLHIAYTKPRSFIDAESALVGGIVSRLSGYVQTIQQQQDADRRAKELIILNEMALALTSVLDLDAMVDTVYQYTAKLTDVTNFFLALYDPETETVTFPIAYSDGQPTEIDSRPLGDSLTDFIIRHGKPLLLNDNVVQRAEEKGIKLVLYGKPVPAQSWLGVPIMLGDQVQGVIAVQSLTTPGLFKEYDQEVLTNIARSVGNALALARQYQKTQDAAEASYIFRQGLENSTDAVFITDMQGTINFVNQAFVRTYGYQPEETIGKTPRILKSGVIPPESYQQFWQNLLNQQIVSGEIVNKRKDGRLISIEGSNIPVTDEQGRLLGFLAIHRDISDRKQAEQELHVSREMLSKRASELAAVAQVSTAAATILEPVELLQRVVDLTKEYFNLYHAHIYLIDENSSTLVLTSGAGEVGRKMLVQNWEIPIEQEQSLVARAARLRKGVIVNDVRADASFLPNDLLLSTASEMAVPLIAGEDLLGVLDVQSDQVDYFTEDDIAVYTTLTYQIAVALNNARLYSRTRLRVQREQALREIATQVRGLMEPDVILRTAVRELGTALGRKTYILLGEPSDELPDTLPGDLSELEPKDIGE